MRDLERLQTSFAEAGIQARHAAAKMADMQRKVGIAVNKAAQNLVYTFIQSERSAVDQLADLVREEDDLPSLPSIRWRDD